MQNDIFVLEDLTTEQSAEYTGLPEPFQFYRLMLKGDHLHFGYWPEKQGALSLEQAQIALFDHLMALLPEPPANILDVGCGLGLSACQLSQKGYTVTAIAPSPELIRYAKSHYGYTKVRFQVAGFLDKEGSGFLSETFDAILFQESLQYLHPLDRVFRTARQMLVPKGHLVICDEMVYDQNIRENTAVHAYRDVLTKLAEAGFRVAHQEPVGNRVQQTCIEMIQRFEQCESRLIEAVNSPNTADRVTHYKKGWESQKAWYEAGKMGYELIMARKDDVMIRAYQIGDEDPILALFHQVFANHRSLSHWHWKFRDNPFGSYRIATATSTDDILAAHYCGYPVPIYSTVGKTESLLSYQIGDSMTNPAFRGSGFGKSSILSRIAHYFYLQFCENEVPFVYGFNTGAIRKLGERFLGYEYISGIPYHVLESIRKKDIPWTTKLGWCLSGFHVEKVDCVTEEYDLFFERVSPNYGILVERRAAYLKWRYLDCPDQVHDIFSIRKWGKLIGWSVFRKKENVLLWGDALFDINCPQAAYVLLNHVICRTLPLRVEAWFSPNPPWWTQALKKMGFIATQEPNRLTPAFKRFSSCFSVSFLENNFYYTMGDSDLY